MTPSGSCEWSKRPTSPSLLDPIPETSQPNGAGAVHEHKRNHPQTWLWPRAGHRVLITAWLPCELLIVALDAGSRRPHPSQIAVAGSVKGEGAGHQAHPSDTGGRLHLCEGRNSEQEDQKKEALCENAHRFASEIVLDGTTIELRRLCGICRAPLGACPRFYDLFMSNQ